MFRFSLFGCCSTPENDEMNIALQHIQAEAIPNYGTTTLKCPACTSLKNPKDLFISPFTTKINYRSLKQAELEAPQQTESTAPAALRMLRSLSPC
jgi:hypothetical protein